MGVIHPGPPRGTISAGPMFAQIRARSGHYKVAFRGACLDQLGSHQHRVPIGKRLRQFKDGSTAPRDGELDVRGIRFTSSEGARFWQLQFAGPSGSLQLRALAPTSPRRARVLARAGPGRLPLWERESVAPAFCC